MVSVLTFFPYHAGLIKPVRTVAFSPASKLLAAAGDATIIGLYDVRSGEQVFNLTGHSAWIFSVDWSHTGEYLLSGYIYLSSSVSSLLTEFLSWLHSLGSHLLSVVSSQHNLLEADDSISCNSRGY